MNPSRIVRAALAALALALAAGTSAPATASPHRSLTYDALGDSYASGWGVPPYEDCGRSQAAYAVQLDAFRRIRLDDFVACAGATTASLVAGGQLDALDRRTDLVTISIGGNDIGWSSAVVACLGGTDEECATTLEAIRGRVTTELPALLDSVYAQIRARAPHARVVVTGYPRLFSPELGDYLGASVAEQQALNAGADLLDAVIARAAHRHHFRFVDVRSRFDGHGVNAADAWILGPADPGAFHPDADGYRAYTVAVARALKPCPRH